MRGDIMTISRLRMGTDGRGVTTLVAFFDCPLHCKYCINDFCHESVEHFDSVPRGAYTPEELIKILGKDEIYYRMSKGGVTFGGGEPLLQSAFIHEVCKLADSSWQMRIETSLNVPWRYVESVIGDIDEWIIDIKDRNPKIYKEYTGVRNDNLIENLFKLKEMAGTSKLHVRVPRIPGFNEEKDIEESVKWIKDVLEIEPEVFDYIKPVRVNEEVCDDDEEIISALLGLIGACNNNPKTANTDEIVTKALAFPVIYQEMDGESSSQIVEQIHAEKNAVAPDCANCACPCGNTSDYDMGLIYGAKNENSDIKREILSGCEILAAYIYLQKERNKEVEVDYEIFYKALSYVRFDREKARLREVLNEIEETETKWICQ